MTCAHTITCKVTGSDERYCTRCQAVLPAPRGSVELQGALDALMKPTTGVSTDKKPATPKIVPLRPFTPFCAVKTAPTLIVAGRQKPPIPTEHEEQVALFQRIDTFSGRFPCLKMLFAIPNGGLRHKVTALKLQQEGVRKGVVDIFCAVPRECEYLWPGTTTKYRQMKHGAFVEMKRRGNTTTPEQEDWIERLKFYQYEVRVCYSADEAWQFLKWYLDLPGEGGIEVQERKG